MLARPLTLALALAVPCTAAAQGFEYAPSAGQYRISSTTKGAQEAMGQKQEFEASNNHLVSVTVARAAKDTLAVTLVIDSLTMVGPMGMTPPGIDKLVGAKISARISPFGAFYSAEGPTDDVLPNASQLTRDLGQFLPRIRAKLAKGTAWTDTTTGTTKMNGLDVDRTIITNFTVLGDTTVAGEKGWKIGRVTNTAMSGSGAPSGQPMTMEGTSDAKGTIVVSNKGVFLGSQSEDQADLKIVLSANGMEIGVTTTATNKVEKVK